MVSELNSEVKIIRSDNAFELGTGNIQSDFLSSQGIIHQTNCVYTPQQNGIVEKKHKHLLETSKALLYQSHLPVSFGEIVYATYLINRYPSRVLHLKTPYEVLFKVKPDYSNIRCFGCLCFASTITNHITKLDPRAVPCVFLGYPHGKKGYKVLNLKALKTTISRYVVFHKEFFPFASINSPTTSHHVLPLAQPSHSPSPVPDFFT